MTGLPPTTPAASSPPGDLAARLFRALYQGYDLHPARGAWFAVPKGTACYAAPTLGKIARQISVREYPDPHASGRPHDSPIGSGPGA